MKLDARQTAMFLETRELLRFLAEHAQAHGPDNTTIASYSNATVAATQRYPVESTEQILSRLVRTSHETLIYAALIAARVPLESTEEHPST